MPPDRPVDPSQLPPVTVGLIKVQEMKDRIRAVRVTFCIGLVLLIGGLFKPLTAYFQPAFPWIAGGFGFVLCTLTVIWVLDLREFMNKTDEKKLAFIFGVVFVVVLLILALFIPNPSDFQYTVFRIVLALAAAGVAAMIPGFLQVTVSTWIRAGGALAIFVIVYFYAPAALHQLQR
jgi:hypothetical protein